MKFVLVELPIDFGHTQAGIYQSEGLEKAPALWTKALQKELPKGAGKVESINVKPPTRKLPWDAPLKFDKELASQLGKASERIATIVARGEIPIVLGGDHSISLATALGLSRGLKRNSQLGAVVLDAHTDFNLPGRVAPVQKSGEIPEGLTISGNAHGMIHALTGRMADGQFDLAKLCEKHSRVNASRVVIMGVRAKRYPQLRDTLERARPLLIEAREINQAVRKKELEGVVKHAVAQATASFREPFYLSLDCDVLDPKEFSSVVTPVNGGLSLSTLEEVLRVIMNQPRVERLLRAVEIAEYCPGAKNGADAAVLKRISRAIADMIGKL